MEPPIVPTSRTRLTRDYTFDDELPPQIRRYREGALKSPSGTPKGYDIDDQLESPVRVQQNSRTGKASQPPRPPAIHHHSGSDRKHDDSSKRNQRYLDNTSEHSSQRKEHEQGRKLDFNLGPSNDTTYYESSITSDNRSLATDALTSSSGSRMPDFFSNDIFQVVLHNPTTSHQLMKFARTRMCAENLEYLAAVDKYHSLLNDVAATLFDVHKNYLGAQASSQINIPEHISTKLSRDLKTSLNTTLPKMEGVFVDSQAEIESLVGNDIYPRFVRHQVTLSATRALAGPKNKYAGLGDCFVLTDPSKADNPIVYASDGFVKVTGYDRNEIIPRNCRFLQGRHTDRKAVKRLKMSINQNEESVELLLNERKDGEPFWNLLLVTPLKDATGNTVFFLGGQINCSTTIHSQSDVLKILSTNEDEQEDTAQAIAQEKEREKSRYGKLFASFRSKPNGVRSQAVPGMEGNLLGKLESLSVKSQLDTFYSAYSKYLILNAQTLLIAFHSPSIRTLLLPTTASTTTQPNAKATRIPSPIGQDVFRFLSNYSPNNSLPSGFKSRIRGAVQKEGRALSLELMLMTQRYQGAERFVAHWTPLKGASEKGREEVGWVVVCLGGGG